MSLVRCIDLCIAFGDHPLLDNADFSVDSGERIGIVGRNGEGKSTLMKILNKQVQADAGEIRFADNCRIAYLPQAPQLAPGQTVYQVVAGGLGNLGDALWRYQLLLEDDNHEAQPHEKSLDELQEIINDNGGWQYLQIIERTLTRLGLDGSETVAQQSGGWQRRISLARALVTEPNLLLLDEPTNHLDIATIKWLEAQLKKFSGAVVFITHDRAFLKSLATSIVDLDNGRLTKWPSDYATYLKRKAADLDAEQQQQALFDKKLAQEEQWIRQGIKARRTRNEGRVRALEKMREQRAQRRQHQGQTRINLEQAEKSGKMVIETTDIHFGFADRSIVRNFSTRIMRGDRVGLLGPNGVGKSTLVRLLLGTLEPQQGQVRHGSNLQIGYFDQLRNQLDEKSNIVDFIGEGKQTININGSEKHIISYLSDFLFTPKRARSPISSLSGGERARVLLAKLFSKPLNLLVLDEPTNDLDIDTLELLEDQLLQYQATLLLVSHDREFLDNVVTSTIAFDDDGEVREYVGGYSDWLKQRPQSSDKAEKQTGAELTSRTAPITSTPQPAATPAPVSAPAVSKPSKKLSYNQQRELAALPDRIETLEQQQSQLSELVSAADFYQGDSASITATLEEIKKVDDELSECYARWEELDG